MPRLKLIEEPEAERMLDALFKLFEEVGEMELSEEEVEEELRLAGYDPKEVTRKFRELIGRMFRDRRGI